MFPKLTLIFLLGCLSFVAATATNAAVITVNTLADEAGSGASCSLREAIIAAETNAAFSGCVAGGVTDDITVQVTGTLHLFSPLPDITKGVNINGGGADLFTIAGNNTFRLLNILLSSAQTVNIYGVSFTGGRKTAGVNASAIEFNNNGTLSLSNCDIYDNSGPSGGAADGSSVLFSNASAQLILTGTTFRNNMVEHVIVIGNTPLTMTNSTVSNNSGTGAGIFIFGGMPAGAIVNSTIANNSQGVWHNNNGPGASTVTLKNSIVAQNSINVRRTGNNACPGVVNNIVSAGYNLFDNTPAGGSAVCTLAGTDLVNTNPQLAPLADHGGGVWTRNLLPNSPGRDRIPAASTFPGADQRGALRPLYGDADIGAVEFTSYVANTDDTGDFSLKEAIASSPVNAPITFDAVFFSSPRTINLPAALLINKAIRINGPGADLLTIAGNSSFRLLNLSATGNRTIQLNDLSFTAGLKTGGANSSVIESNDGAAPLEINRCEFFGNGTAAVPSPVLFTNLAKKITINASTISSNQVGHVLMIGSSPVDIVNSTISGHTGTGAAVFVFGCEALVNVTSSTITGNPQGLWNACSDSVLVATINVKNTLLSQNGNLNIRRSGTFPTSNRINTLGHNLLDDNSGSQFVNSDASDRLGAAMNPQLAPLAYYGGGTRTHALKAGSAALNFGTGTGVPAVDQRGSPRVIGGTADIGAFERNIIFDQTSVPLGRVDLAYNMGTPFQLSATRQTSFAVKGTEPLTVDNFVPASFALVPAPGQAFPPGLSLLTDGKITGTPTATGAFTFTIKATDADGMAGVAQFTTTILPPPTAALVSVSGRVLTPDSRGLKNARVFMTGETGETRYAVTSSFGYFRFDAVPAGATYVVGVSSKLYQLSPRTINVADELTDVDFVADFLAPADNVGDSTPLRRLGRKPQVDRVVKKSP